jgi:hypothetical protein
LGLQINTASFAMYTFSLAVLIQALTLISFSALADYGMISFHTTGAQQRIPEWSRIANRVDLIHRE